MKKLKEFFSKVKFLKLKLITLTIALSFVLPFDLVTKPIQIEDHCWIGAKAQLAPGTHLHEGTVLVMGYRASGEYRANTVFLRGREKARELSGAGK